MLISQFGLVGDSFSMNTGIQGKGAKGPALGPPPETASLLYVSGGLPPKKGSPLPALHS